MTVTFVALSCTGPCADVVAVPTGGNAPYTFRWNDGSTTATRHVCPTASTSYAVTVTDTGTTGELVRAAEAVQVPLEAHVIACPDGGTSDAGAGGQCFSNPSFEGTPLSTLGPDIGAPPWVGCMQGPFHASGILASSTPTPLGAYPAASDGATFLQIEAVAAFSSYGSVSEPLCDPMRAGTPYSFKVDLMSVENLGGQAPAFLQILGSTGSCDSGQLLWSSPLAGPTWTTYCATFTPTQETTYLGLGAGQADAGAAGQLLVDHIVPVTACP